MATRPRFPLDAMFAAIPSLPRPVLSRLVTRMIERLDEIDGDPDAEDDSEDCCEAGDDMVRSGPGPATVYYLIYSSGRMRYPGCEDDAEPDWIDQPRYDDRLVFRASTMRASLQIIIGAANP